MRPGEAGESSKFVLETVRPAEAEKSARVEGFNLMAFLRALLQQRAAAE